MSTPPVPFPGSYWAVPGKLLAGFYPGARDHMEAAAKITALLNSGNGQLTDIFFQQRSGRLSSDVDWFYSGGPRQQEI